MLFNNILKEVDMKGKSLAGSGMGLGNFTMKMGDIMMGCGSRIRCKVLGDYFINLISWPMKENGEMIDFMGRE